MTGTGRDDDRVRHRRRPRGSFARTRPRILSISSYIPAERKKGKRRFDVDFAGDEEALPPQVRFALS